MFASAINTQAHLNSFKSLADLAKLGVEEIMETVAEIEEKIRWMQVKVPEIEKWVNALGTKITISILAVLASFAVFILQ